MTSPVPLAGLRASVVVPVHRAAETIEQCLASLLHQTQPAEDYEVILVFNGPDDGSRAIAEALAGRFPDHHVVMARSETASAGAARNVGLDLVRGAHVTFVDADDWVSENYLAELLAVTQEGRIPAAGIVDVHADGTENEATSVNLTLSKPAEHLVPVAHASALSAMNACKLLPGSWLVGHRFEDHLRSGEDVAFHGTLLAPYGRRFSEYDRRPLENGATYYRRLSDDSVSRQGASFDFGVEQRLQTMVALTRGTEHHPDDRAPLTTNLLRGQARLMALYLRDHPDQATTAYRAIAESGVLGVSLPSVEDDGEWPGLERVFTERAWTPPTSFTLVASSAASFTPLAPVLRYLYARKVRLNLAFRSGAVDPELDHLPHYRLRDVEGVAPAPPTTGAPGVGPSGGASPARATAQHVGTAGARLASLGARTTRRVLRRVRRALPEQARPGQTGAAAPARSAAPAPDPVEALETVDRLPLSDRYIAIDDAGRSLLEEEGLHVSRIALLHAQVVGVAAARVPTDNEEAKLVLKSARAAASESSPDEQPPAHVWAMAGWQLLRQNRLKRAATLLDLGMELFPERTYAEGLAAVRATCRTVETGTLPPDATDITSRTIRAADEAYAQRDIDRAAFLSHVVLDLLFHQDVQASSAHAPLLDDPAHLLEGLEGSQVWRALQDRRPAAVDKVPGPAGTSRVLMLPGAYPKFQAAVQRALAGHARVDVLDMREVDKSFRTLRCSASQVRHYLAEGYGATQSPAPPEVAEQFARADTVMVDWIDHGAVLASQLTPPGTRLVLRYLGVDSLSLWQFLVDWSRVTDVVFVSEHLQRSVERILGDRIAHVRTHVIDNGVDVERFSGPSTEDAPRTLGMVGWAQKVKDPLWTLEVLALLRAHDPSWRLKLIGADFAPTIPRLSELRVAQEFRARAQQPDLAGGIEYVGYTNDLPRHLAGVGFAISSSLRESWHIGAVEMVAAGAVPVFRDWPVYREIGGASRLFDEAWVVDTPEQAAARILAHADRETWARASEEARRRVREDFSLRDVSADYRQILLGTDAG